jgi:hypothetical protein
MPTDDDFGSRAADGWNKQRAWHVVVKLAEAHLKLQVSYGKPFAPVVNEPGSEVGRSIQTSHKLNREA